MFGQVTLWSCKSNSIVVKLEIRSQCEGVGKEYNPGYNSSVSGRHFPTQIEKERRGVQK